MSVFYRLVNRCPGGTLYTIRAGDTLYAIARRFNITVDAIIRANPGIDPRNLRIGERICLPGIVEMEPCPGGRIYRIQPGDTFYRIAQRFNIPLDLLLRANPGVDPNRLRVGQEICIPAIPRPEPQLPAATALDWVHPDIEPGLASGGFIIGTVPRDPDRNLATFVAAAMPAPSDFGDYDTYVGAITMDRRTSESPRTITIALQESPAPANQHPTWSGSRTVPALGAGDVVEIRAADRDTGQLGPAVMRATLGR